MLEPGEYLNDLIKIAKIIEKGWASIPLDENGEPTKSYLQYLSYLFDPEIASIVKHLNVFPNVMSIIKISKKTGFSKEALAEKLSGVIERGYIFNRSRHYAISMPVMIRNAPFILKKNYDDPNLDLKEYAEISRRWFEDDKYYHRWETTLKGTPRMRVVTVSEEVEPTHQIAPIEEIYTIIEQYDEYPIVIIPCPCRMRWEALGERKCKDKYPIHNCLNVGPQASVLVEHDDPNIKVISKEEAKKVTREAAEIGLVHAIDNTAKYTSIICACCECCCGTLAGITRFDNPRAVAKANFVADINQEDCIACGTCLDRCKFHAITLNDFAEVNLEKCMGCGLCTVTCPEKAIVMKRMVRERIPFSEIKPT
jgi:ferredoxin